MLILITWIAYVNEKPILCEHKKENILRICLFSYTQSFNSGILKIINHHYSLTSINTHFCNKICHFSYSQEVSNFWEGLNISFGEGLNIWGGAQHFICFMTLSRNPITSDVYYLGKIIFLIYFRNYKKKSRKYIS